jgi:hypothetical protein
MLTKIELVFGVKGRKEHVIYFLDFFLIYLPYNDDLIVPSNTCDVGEAPQIYVVKWL